MLPPRATASSRSGRRQATATVGDKLGLAARGGSGGNLLPVLHPQQRIPAQHRPGANLASDASVETQDSEFGFSGDPDGVPEPMLWLRQALGG